MKRYGILIGICFFMLANLFAAKTDDKKKNDSDRAFLYFIANDSIDHEVIGYFYSLQSPLYSEALAPKFIVASRNRNVMLGIGGYVQLRAQYDFRGVCDAEEFHTYIIPVPNRGNPSQELRMGAGSSRLFMRVIANTSRLGQLTAYVEGDFLGRDRAFRLRQANVSFLGFTFGQALSTYIDVAAYAPSLDQNGGIVVSNQRNPLVRYQRAIGKKISFAVSAEMPPFSGSYLEGVTDKAHAQIPDFPFYLQFKNRNNHVRLSGMFRSLPYKDVITGSYDRVFGIGGKLSGSFELMRGVEAMFHTSYGKGTATYALDLDGAGMDILNDYSRPGKMFAPRTAVYYGGFRFRFNKNLYAGTAYNHIRLYTNASFQHAGDFDGATFYKYAQSATACLIWNFLPSASCGIEYLWGQRHNFDGSRGHANRVSTSVRYNF
ncbi:MAG: DcaP family trimeric outer membrane transporter [Bacteroidales bacterium]